MLAGDLRQRVTIEQQLETSDGHDGVVLRWLPVHARIPARIRPLTGRDLKRARQVDPRITHDVRLRFWRNYRDDLNAGRNRLIYHDTTDREFEIVGPPVDVDERHVELVQTCREALKTATEAA